MKELPKVIAVIGTNASGKSDLGIKLAQKYSGEIISADSRQVYCGLDLGSGKITEAEMQGVPHYMIDIRKAGDFFSMADFQRMSYKIIDDILLRNKTPFIVGGTGLYVDSVLDGYLLSDKAPDLAYRLELEKLTTVQLYEMLLKFAPGVTVDHNNRNRVMRMLERIHDGDNAEAGKSSRYNSLRLGVSWPKQVLDKRIDERLYKRIQQGMIDEVYGLMAKGVDPQFLISLGLEYRFITQYLLGMIESQDEMICQLSRAIKKFAKRQMTWFKRNKSIVWLEMDKDPFHQACDAIDAFLMS